MIGAMPTLPPSAELLAELGRLIRARRERLGYTIHEAVELTPGKRNRDNKGPMSPTTWARIEKGHGGRAHGSTYLRIETVIGWEPGACGRFLDDGTPPALAGRGTLATGSLAHGAAVQPVGDVDVLTAAELVDEAPEVTHTMSERNGLVRMDVTYADTSEAIFVLAARDDLELTPQERTELARIAAAVWRRNHPESNSDTGRIGSVD